MSSARMSWLAGALLFGAILVGSVQDTGAAASPTFTVTSIEVSGDNPLSSSCTERLLRPYLGEQFGMAGLQQAAQALEQALHEQGYAFYRVVLPPQEVTGSVRLEVRKTVLGKLAVAPQGAVSEQQLASWLPGLRTGASPNLRELSRSLALANANPARQLAVKLLADPATERIDATVEVTQRSPYSLLLRADNSGNELPARSRLSLVLQHANLFGRDHVATLSYTTSPEATDEVRQYGAFYQVPVYAWGGSLAGYYFHSSIDSGSIGGVFAVKGSGEFWGLSYTQDFWPRGGLTHSLQLSFDDKLFQDQTSFVGTPIGSDVRSEPVALTYAGQLAGAGWQAGYSLAYARNLGLGSSNETAAYAAVRSGARAGWDLWRLQGTYRLGLPHRCALLLRLAGQYAEQPLIAGEEFGIGGADSVRGLETRQVLGDSGAQGSLELWGPRLPGGLTPLLFFDAGKIWRQAPPTGIAAVEAAHSVGAGLRWDLLPGTDLSLDYGYLLDGVTATPAGNVRFDVALTWRL